MSFSLLQRHRFHRDPDAPTQAASAQALLRVLLHQDGSTTRLLEALGGGDLRVHVIEQGLVTELPLQLAGSMPGSKFLRRLTTLEANGRVLLDSLAYIAVGALPGPLVQELLEGIRPIGHVLAHLWTRRAFRALDDTVFEELWAVVGLPDPLASRSTSIATPAGLCMVLAETFRRGVLDEVNFP